MKENLQTCDISNEELGRFAGLEDLFFPRPHALPLPRPLPLPALVEGGAPLPIPALLEGGVGTDVSSFLDRAK